MSFGLTEEEKQAAFNKMLAAKDEDGVKVTYKNLETGERSVMFLNPGWPVPMYINPNTYLFYNRLDRANRRLLEKMSRKKGGNR